MRQSVLRNFVAVLLVTATAVGMDTAAARGPLQQFSAETYQKAPQGGEQSGKLFVGAGVTRREMAQNGEQIIQIADDNKGAQWVIFPSRRSYMEQQSPAGMAPAGAADNNPCAVMPGATCTDLGSEVVSGRKAEKWQIQMSYQGQIQSITQWIDSERGNPLRSESAAGRMEFRLVGQDSVAGRPVEKWEMSVTQGNTPPQRSYQWYDPQLGVTIREEMPGGYVRELRNIQVGTQPGELFVVPAGFQKMDPQQIQMR